MKGKDGSNTIKDESQLKDDEIWGIYSGPRHQRFNEKDYKYMKYVTMLCNRIGISIIKSDKHTVTFCPECFCFNTFEGEQLNELGHPRDLLITKTRLCKKENIKDIDTFIEWNKRTTQKIRYKGRNNEMSIAPVFNCYHKPSEYDGISTHKEKRSYVIELEKKVRKLEAENEMLRKRLLALHAIEFATPESISTKMLK